MAICPIPQPPVRWMGLLGNLPDIDINHLPESFAKLAEIYGEIYQLDLGSGRTVVLATPELCREASDETRFYKAIANTNKELRNLMGDGIFTSHTKEESWKKAHRILMPLFGPLSIKAMFPSMMDVASQLILKWDRFGPKTVFDCVEDYTKLTLDTIALIGFDYRFNSLHKEETHPFVSSMIFGQIESGRRANRMNIETQLRIFSQAKYFQQIKIMHDICDEVVRDRKEKPRETPDILNAMLNGRDPESNEKLSDENIRNQMVTFLIAGHETTSGTLGFCTYLLLKNPEKLAKARAEVDEIVGDKPLEQKHLPQLKYLEAVIRESLRLYPTAPGWSVHSYDDTTLLAGKYQVRSTDRILMSLPRIHRDTRVFGDDAEEFRPERMLHEHYGKLPPGSYKPFGNGVRACIGRGFALQEATIVLALMLQRFDIELADPNYELEIMSTLTIKPKGLRIRVKRRPEKGIWVGLSTSLESAGKSLPGAQDLQEAGLPLLQILFGSNQGTCLNLAEAIQSQGPKYGFRTTVSKMDEATGNLSEEGPLLFITSSYEGQPPENAKRFMSWLKSLSDKSTEKRACLRYAVLGVGSSDWPTTFHRVPKLLEEYLSIIGASPIVPLGLINTTGDIMTDFEDWGSSFWNHMTGGADNTRGGLPGPALKISMDLKCRPRKLGVEDIGTGIVLSSREVAPARFGPAKRHVEVQLDSNTFYKSGDYLTVLPTNHQKTVQRVLARFAIPEDAIVELTGSPKTFLPISQPICVRDLLEAYVELSTPVSKKQLIAMAQATENPEHASELERLGGVQYENEILHKRTSIIDILEHYKMCNLSFASYIDMLQPMKPRQYSISSAPSLMKLPKEPQVCSITFDIFDAPALSGTSHFYGVASSYLAGLHPGQKLRCAVRPTQMNFAAPPDKSAPVIMIAAGTGIAPMRSFIQERANVLNTANGFKYGPWVLYYGCRNPDVDFLFKKELDDAEQNGLVRVRPTFSKTPEKAGGFKYVDERMWNEKEEIMDLIQKGAKILLCGSVARLSRSATAMLVQIYRNHSKCDEEAAQEWLQAMKDDDRYVSDIFG